MATSLKMIARQIARQHGHNLTAFDTPDWDDMDYNWAECKRRGCMAWACFSVQEGALNGEHYLCFDERVFEPCKGV